MSVFIGLVVKSRCGLDLTVCNIVEDKILMQDQFGRQREVSKKSVLNKDIKWTYSSGDFYKSGREGKDIKVGDVFPSMYYGDFEILEDFGHKFTIKFLRTGYVKYNCKRCVVQNGCVKDGSVKCKLIYEFTQGKLIQMRDVVLEVIECVSSTKILCKVLETGETRYFTAAKLRDLSRVVKTSENPPDGCYIYYIWQDDKIVYVGRGNRFRYKHANSGRSTCRELNRLHFLGVKFRVTIEEQGLTYEESKRQEKIHMNKFTDLFNEVIYIEG